MHLEIRICIILEISLERLFSSTLKAKRELERFRYAGLWFIPQMPTAPMSGLAPGLLCVHGPSSAASQAAGSWVSAATGG